MTLETTKAIYLLSSGFCIGACLVMIMNRLADIILKRPTSSSAHAPNAFTVMTLNAAQTAHISTRTANANRMCRVRIKAK